MVVETHTLATARWHSYNSKQLVKEFSGQYKVGRWFYEGPTAGRWIVNTWPSLEQAGPDVYYFTTPDGAVHKRDDKWLHYYRAKNSTNIRYNSANQRVEFMGGDLFDFSDYDSQLKVCHLDRNGNQITYEFENVSGYKRPYRIVDTLGRQVLLSYESVTLLDQIVVKNHAGADLVYSLDSVTKLVDPAALEWYYWTWVRYYGCDISAV